MVWIKLADKAKGKKLTKYWMNVKSSGHRAGQKVGTKLFSTTTLSVRKTRPKISLKYFPRLGVYRESKK